MASGDRRSILIDTDPGTDDAVALLLALASPELEILGITAVAGNLPLVLTERNARAICELAGRPDVPVHAGCPRPMGRVLVTAEHIHGPSGLGNLVLPTPTATTQPQHGVDFIVDTVRAAEPGTITLCTLGPLTNVAMALVKAPEIAARIAELVMMGGGSVGYSNVTPVAEFNIYVDPHAAALVFGSGIPITVMPLDVTHQVRSTPERVAAVRAAGTRCAKAAAELMRRPDSHSQAPALHDPCVIAYLLAPDLFAGERVNVAVETESALTLGMTVIDWRGVSGRPANARVMREVDAEGVYRLIAERLAVLP